LSAWNRTARRPQSTSRPSPGGGSSAPRPTSLAKAVRAEPQTRAAERPVVRPLPEKYPFFQYPRVIRMFSKEDAVSGMGGVAGESGKGDMPAMPRTAGMSDEAKSPGAKPKPAAKAFPRKVRRFSKPEEGGTE
jgi:hypothetical protein